jgi:hypothetical protein
MSKILNEEEMTKEDIMIKQKRGRYQHDVLDWIERQEKSLRAEGNREWRDGNEWKETETLLIAERKCFHLSRYTSVVRAKFYVSIVWEETAYSSRRQMGVF